MSGLLATVVIGVLTFTYVPIDTASAQYAATEVPFTRLVQGKQSSIDSRVNYLITSSDELIELWNIIGATSTPPAVDFTTQSVLAVFADQSPRVTITEIKDIESKRLVSIVVTKSEEVCATQQQNASPYEIVSVAATSLALIHQDIVETASCAN